jgi:carboxymethylenebutenolidase
MAHDVIKFSDPAGNQIPGWLFKPKAGRGIGVCMIHDVFGLRDDYENVVAPFVEHGYVVLLPDMFYDVQPKEVIDADGNKRRSFGGLSSEAAHWVIAQAAIKKLKSMPETGGKVGVTGYCLGGTLCVMAAARLDEIGAAAGYYATRAHDHLDELPGLKRPLILHMSETDRTHKPEDDDNVRNAMAKTTLGKCYTYPGTVHGFANNDHLRYDAAQTKIANQRTFELFDSIK